MFMPLLIEDFGAINFFRFLRVKSLFGDIPLLDIWKRAKHDLKYSPPNSVIENKSGRGE
jgi:hypothetical protein